MAAFRAAIVLGVCLFYSYSAMAQQCDQAEQQFHDCLRSSFKDQDQQKKDFSDIKAKADKCFTDNGCDVPSFPQGGPGGAGGPQGGAGGQGPRGGKGGSSGQKGPRGGQGNAEGREGRQGAGGSDSNRQCFQAVSNKTKDYMLQCIRKSDPSFNFPNKQGPGGPGGHGGPGGSGGPGGHGGFGGFGGGDHDGPRPGGPGGAGGHGFQGGEQFLLQTCKNNQANADKAKACLSEAFMKPQAQDQAKMKAAFDARCQAKSQCEAKLGSCKDVLEKRRQAMCTCGQEVRSKRQEFLQQEPTCQNVQQPQSGGKGPGQGKQRDCSKKPQDPCEQGFDATMKQMQSHRRPGGN